MAFDFPGNVRQLENICHWLTVMAPAQVVEAKDLPPELLAEPSPRRGRAGRRGRRDRRAQPRRRRSRASCAAAPRRQTPQRHRLPAHAPVPTGWPTWSARPRVLLDAGTPEVWEALTRQFEAQLIQTALDTTRGRRIEAAQKPGHRPQHDHAQDPGARPGRLMRSRTSL